MKNITTRALAGIVYIAIILAAIWSGPSGVLCLGLLFTLLASIEMQNLCCGKNKTYVDIACKASSVISAIAIFSVLNIGFLWPLDTANNQLAFRFIATALSIGLACLPIRFILTLYDTSGQALQRIAYTILGLVYICLPLASMCWIDSPYLLMLFIMIWVNDTGAYCVGSMFGRRRLFERLSPKKSWEGFWGGMAFAIAAGVIYAIISFDKDSTAYTYPAYIAIWAATGAAISTAATLGDLFESLIKRSLGVKDSGKIIPGHGGILDRIDSLLFAAPVMCALYILMFC